MFFSKVVIKKMFFRSGLSDFPRILGGRRHSRSLRGGDQIKKDETRGGESAAARAKSEAHMGNRKWLDRSRG